MFANIGIARPRKANSLVRNFAILMIVLFNGGIARSQELLSEPVISQFAQTWPQISQRLIIADPEFDPLNVPGLIDQLNLMADIDGPQSARDRAVQGDGYPDFESWATNAEQIIQAAQWAINPPDAHDIDEVIAAINADTQRSQDDKASAIADLKSALDTSLKLKPDALDIALASKFLPLLNSILAPR